MVVHEKDALGRRIGVGRHKRLLIEITPLFYGGPNPKPEDRNPKEIRSPKSEAGGALAVCQPGA
jgi:hypothetical protein